MAANMKAVKLRIKSVQSTMQITKAMELVASSKLRKAKERRKSAGLILRPCIRPLWILPGGIQIFPLYMPENPGMRSAAMC